MRVSQQPITMYFPPRQRPPSPQPAPAPTTPDWVAPPDMPARDLNPRALFSPGPVTPENNPPAVVDPDATQPYPNFWPNTAQETIAARLQELGAERTREIVSEEMPNASNPTILTYTFVVMFDSATR